VVRGSTRTALSLWKHPWTRETAAAGGGGTRAPYRLWLTGDRRCYAAGHSAVPQVRGPSSARRGRPSQVLHPELILHAIRSVAPAALGAPDTDISLPRFPASFPHPAKEAAAKEAGAGARLWVEPRSTFLGKTAPESGGNSPLWRDSWPKCLRSPPTAHPVARWHQAVEAEGPQAGSVALSTG
jgi:hypothetical protein